MTQHAEAKNIYQRISLETFIEINLAANCWNADAVSVMRDAGHDAGEEPPVGGDLFLSILCGGTCVACAATTAATAVLRDWPEVQRVQAKFRTRAHGENVSNDPAYAGGRALERLNRARMVVALHLERDRPAVADIHHAGVFFACLNQNVWSRCGKFLQLFLRILVRAVFAPHDRKNPQLGKIRFATENFFDPLEFFASEAVSPHEFRCNKRIGRRRFASH